jgi:putative flippase GtrA
VHEDASTVDLARPAPAEAALHLRVRAGLRRPANWWQLIRFGLVGASGYVVNLAVFALLHGLGSGHRLAATGAFLVAVSNNFVWNRQWTFRARDGHAGAQAARFLLVSIGAFVVNLGFLELFVEVAAMPEVLAQAIAVALAMPLSFAGNKLWSFRT